MGAGERNKRGEGTAAQKEGRRSVRLRAPLRPPLPGAGGPSQHGRRRALQRAPGRARGHWQQGRARAGTTAPMPPTPTPAASRCRFDARRLVARSFLGAHDPPCPLRKSQVVVIGMSLGYILFVTMLHIIGKVRADGCPVWFWSVPAAGRPPSIARARKLTPALATETIATPTHTHNTTAARLKSDALRERPSLPSIDKERCAGVLSDDLCAATRSPAGFFCRAARGGAPGGRRDAFFFGRTRALSIFLLTPRLPRRFSLSIPILLPQTPPRLVFPFT